MSGLLTCSIPVLFTNFSQLQWNLSVIWIDHMMSGIQNMNLEEDIIQSSKTADLLPHLHELVDDKASDLYGQQ